LNKVDKKAFNYFFLAFMACFAVFMLGEITSRTLAIWTGESGYALYCLPLFYAIMAAYWLFVIKSFPIIRTSPVPLFQALVLVAYAVSLCWLVNGSFPNPSDYLRIPLPLLAIGFAYSLTMRMKDTRWIAPATFVAFVMMVVRALQCRQIVLDYRHLDEGVSAGYYYPLYFLPVVLASHRRWVRLSGIALVMVAVVQSAKRGGLVAFLLGLAAYMLCQPLVANAGRKKFRKFATLAIMALVLTGFFADRVMNSDLLVVKRMSEIEQTGGSGRTFIWQTTIRMIDESPIWNWVAGHGWNTVVKDSPLMLSAHNDPLEIMYDLGVFVLLLYLVLHAQIIRRCIVMTRQHSRYAPAMACSYGIFLVNSLVSHIFLYTSFLLVFAVVWGILIGLYDRERASQRGKEEGLGVQVT
jgi:O-antigen ligase